MDRESVLKCGCMDWAYVGDSGQYLYESVVKLRNCIDELERTMALNRPTVDHYQTGSIECIDALREVLGINGFIGYCRGNVIKYLWRLGRKGSTVDELVADVEKARNYCDFLLSALKEVD